VHTLVIERPVVSMRELVVDDDSAMASVQSRGPVEGGYAVDAAAKGMQATW
jgi:CheY-like chemotaxis protein